MAGGRRRVNRKRSIMGAIGTAVAIIALVSGLLIVAFYLFMMFAIASWGSSK